MVARRRVATPAGDYDGTVRAVAALVAAMEAATDAGFAGFGIGIPGSLSPATGLVRNANSTCLNDRPFGRDLEAALGRTVRVENDADCFALAEARQGAGRGFGVVLGLILGTGVGSGIVIGGAIRRGRNGIGGEWGHTALPWLAAEEHPGPLCWCGRRGCVETWISGPGMAADHARATGEALSAEAIAARAAAGDAAATATLARHRDRLARGLAQVVDVLDPDVIVLGGGLSNIDGLAETLPGLMAPHVFSDIFETPVRRHSLGDSAGVIGAAWAWPGGDTLA